MYDIAIIGAGCLGNYLAMKLSQHGFRVLVTDKKSEAGTKVCCTGIISKKCHDLLSEDIIPIVKKIKSVLVSAPYNHCFDLNNHDNFFYVVNRPELEKSLSIQAQSNGAELKFATEVTNIEIENNHVIINTLTREGFKCFSSRMAVIATGYGSRLTRKLGLGQINHYVIGIQSEVMSKEDNRAEIYIDKQVSSPGFAWLVPTWNNRAFAGLLCKTNPKIYMKRFLEILESQNKIIKNNNDFELRLIPIKPLKKTYTERVLVIGEAAGQVKPLTGGGIYYGILGANIAFEIINNAFIANNFSEQFLSTYQKLWHSKLKQELDTGYYLRSLWEKLNNNNINMLFNLVEKSNITEQVNNSNNLDFDRHIKSITNLLKTFISFTKRK